MMINFSLPYSVVLRYSSTLSKGLSYSSPPLHRIAPSSLRPLTPFVFVLTTLLNSIQAIPSPGITPLPHFACYFLCYTVYLELWALCFTLTTTSSTISDSKGICPRDHSSSPRSPACPSEFFGFCPVFVLLLHSREQPVILRSFNFTLLGYLSGL